MGKLKAPPKTPSTVADLIHRLGDIAPERILMHPATENDLLNPDIVGDHIYELIDGVLVEKTVGQKESMLAYWIGAQFFRFPNIDNVGLLFGADGPFKFLPGLVRIPDLAFVRWDSFADATAWEQSNQPFVEIPPDLAIEVLSPSNTKREMERKVKDYADAGVRLVWLVDPKTETVTVLSKTKLKKVEVYTVEDTLDGGKVLPGFTLPIRTIFAPRAPKKS